MSLDLTVENYTDKSIVVRGSTKEYIDELKQLGGKWNSRLRDGPGWIFPKSKEKIIKSFISSGQTTVVKQVSVSNQKKDNTIFNKLSLLESKVDALQITLEKILTHLFEFEENDKDNKVSENIPVISSPRKKRIKKQKVKLDDSDEEPEKRKKEPIIEFEDSSDDSSEDEKPKRLLRR